MFKDDSSTRIGSKDRPPGDVDLYNQYKYN